LVERHGHDISSSRKIEGFAPVRYSVDSGPTAFASGRKSRYV